MNLKRALIALAIAFALFFLTSAARTQDRPKDVTIDNSVVVTLNKFASLLSHEWAFCLNEVSQRNDTIFILGIDAARIDSPPTAFGVSFSCRENTFGTWHNHVPEASPEAEGCYFSMLDVESQDAGDWNAISLVSCGPRSAPKIVYRVHEGWRTIITDTLK